MICRSCNHQFSEREAYSRIDPEDKNKILMFCPQCKTIAGTSAAKITDEITPLPSGNMDGLIVD